MRLDYIGTETSLDLWQESGELTPDGHNGGLGMVCKTKKSKDAYEWLKTDCRAYVLESRQVWKKTQVS